jgi:hypothetical protein
MRETRVADATDLEPARLREYPEIIDDLRKVFLCAPTDELVRDHVANMLVVHEATRFLSRDARRKRRGLIMGSALGIGALVAGTGAAAASGRLPNGLQDAVANVVEPLGVDVPGGKSDDAPGRGGENPGHSDEAPGQQTAPGNSENAPGHGGENPGRSETAPGHSESENNKPDVPPGQSEAHGNAPDEPPGQANVPPSRPKASPDPATPNENSAKDGGQGRGQRGSGE